MQGARQTARPLLAMVPTGALLHQRARSRARVQGVNPGSACSPWCDLGTAPTAVRVTTPPGRHWALPKSQHDPVRVFRSDSRLPRCQGSGVSASWRKARRRPHHPQGTSLPVLDFGPSVSTFLELLQVINGSKARLPSGVLTRQPPLPVPPVVGGWLGGAS